GMIVRTAISELRTIGRATQGVRIIALKPEDKLISVARVVIDDEEDDGQAKLPLTDVDDVVEDNGQPKLPLTDADSEQ
ncbi:MAG TPA: hypothetical protein ENL03_01790, partial [Phycisphaerae bacterium]|nr:hypothetical protein [Phycisphaerae bacterium]